MNFNPPSPKLFKNQKWNRFMCPREEKSRRFMVSSLTNGRKLASPTLSSPLLSSPQRRRLQFTKRINNESLTSLWASWLLECRCFFSKELMRDPVILSIGGQGIIGRILRKYSKAETARYNYFYGWSQQIAVQPSVESRAGANNGGLQVFGWQLNPKYGRLWLRRLIAPSFLNRIMKPIFHQV